MFVFPYQRSRFFLFCVLFKHVLLTTNKQTINQIANGCSNFALLLQRSWIQKCEGGNILKLDKVIFPIHRDGSHWACAVAFMKTKHICYYDSCPGRDGKIFTDDIMKCLSEEWGEYQMPGRFPSKDWTINDVEVPMQGNHYNCGIFICMFRYLACTTTGGSQPLFDQTFVSKNKVRKTRIALAVT